MKVIINENQRGLLIKNGRFSRLLEPGRYTVFGAQTEKLPVDREICSELCPLETLLADPSIKKNAVSVEVGDQQLALHFVDSIFSGVLKSGRHAFWKQNSEHTFQLVDISTPEISEDVPPYLFAKLPSSCYIAIGVEEHQRALLFFNGRYVRLLEPGMHCFWNNGVRVDAKYIDTRLCRLDISGQEMLTQDKVAVRVNFTINYRVTDCVRIVTEIDDFTEQLHLLAQFALREHIGRLKIDELLESREQLSSEVAAELKAKASGLFVEIAAAGIKDIILPGDVREIMNTVLLAEKRAQANVITRREEVASTRSLLNTARLMDENATLFKLKELEYIERICENVNSINLNGSGGVLGQLAAMLTDRKNSEE